MRINMSAALQGIIIYWISTSALLRFSFSRSHGMETHKVIFSFFSECSLFLCSCALVVPLLYKYSELLKISKIWVSFWPILKVNATACLIVRVSGVLCGSPPRITLISSWSVPQLNFSRRRIVQMPRFSLVVLLSRVLTFYLSYRVLPIYEWYFQNRSEVWLIVAPGSPGDKAAHG